MRISVAKSPDDIYPASDGKPMAETGYHALLMVCLHQMLRHRFRDREDVYVAINMFLYYVEGKPKKRRTPDVMVIKGVKGSHERRSFKTWVESVVPACIFEITSKKTADEDLHAKKLLYQRLGVREYILFDPLNDYLPKQLMGHRLVGKKYKGIPARLDGSIVSKELGLRLCPEGTDLGLYDSKSGERQLNLEELHQYHAKKLDEERRRLAELQAELARLKK